MLELDKTDEEKIELYIAASGNPAFYVSEGDKTSIQDIVDQLEGEEFDHEHDRITRLVYIQISKLDGTVGTVLRAPEPYKVERNLRMRTSGSRPGDVFYNLLDNNGHQWRERSSRSRTAWRIISYERFPRRFKSVWTIRTTEARTPIAVR
jgi:hypothetical protein